MKKLTETSNPPSTPKRKKHLRVPVLPEEELQIKDNAQKANLSIAEYLRRIGLGCEIRSMVDEKNILELVKINGDLGRLGGLLKLWLTSDERVSHFNPKTIVALLERIHQTQTAMLEAANDLKGRG